MQKKTLGRALAALLPLLIVAGLWALPLNAADHEEAPGAQADLPADIADLYHWHTEAGTGVTVLTFGGIANANAPVYDSGVLYTIHIDTDADNESDQQVHVRFGQDGDGNWGVQATLASALGSITMSGSTGDVIVDTLTGTQLWTGIADDPFFFDLAGFGATIANITDPSDPADIAFTATDALAGANTTAIVIEGPSTATNYQVWATTGRDNG